MLPRLSSGSDSSASDHRSLFLGRYDRLVSRARTLLGSRVELAHDLVHEAFVQFITRRPSLEAIDDLEAYLHGMVRYLHLSRVRRAGRFPMLPIADFDSVLVGLHGTDGTGRIHALHELAHLCRYASVRKESSPAASVLILRFFWGFSPSAVARIAQASPVVIAQRLRRARVEAKRYLASPGRLAFLRHQKLPPLVAFDSAAPIHDTCAHALAAIVRTRRRACLTEEAIEALYAGVESVPTGTLAHLSSCHACIDRVTRQLGLERDEVFAFGGDVLRDVDVEDGRRTDEWRADGRRADGRADGRRTNVRRVSGVALALLLGWLLFGGGASTVAAAAGRVWRWVSHAAAGVTGPRASASSSSSPEALRLPLTSKPFDIAPLALPRAPASTPVAALVSASAASASVSAMDLIDLEVQAFQRLDRIDALLGEQIATTRTRDQVRLSMVVDEAPRARQLRATLAPLASDHRVVIRVEAARDLATRAAANRGRGTGAVGSAGAAAAAGARRGTVRQYTVDADSSAMRDDLRAYVSRSAPDQPQDAAGLADAEHDLARHVVDASHRALRHTWALRRLVEAFTVAEVSAMRGPTAAAWHELIASHVHGYRRELREVTRMLTTVVTPPSEAPLAAAPSAQQQDRNAAADAAAADAAAVQASLRRLLACASDVDAAVQRSFRSSRSDDEASTSTTNAASAAGATSAASAATTGGASVKTATFWRTLFEAQRLAAAIDPVDADRDP
jgi:DNA-directed RNA polymerase specialized sigma24 family protein